MPLVPPIEVAMILSSASCRSCPGPGSVPYSVWKEIHKATPALIPGIMSVCLQFDFHPSCLKYSNGFILPKSGKADYTTPHSFRVIILLDSFSKILEKAVQFDLSAMAHLRGLVSVHQAGFLTGVSAEDAATRLIHETNVTHRSGLCATTGFFDIKGGFDNVSHSILLDRLTSLGTTPYLFSWSEPFCSGPTAVAPGHFLSNRPITLVYLGAPNLSAPVSVGVPQGSPVFPLFIVIFVAPLHAPDGISFRLSYVHGFSLTIASTSYEQNSRKLIAAFNSLTTLGRPIRIPFAPEKTEVIHWKTYRQRSPAPFSPIQLGGQSTTPSTSAC